MIANDKLELLQGFLGRLPAPIAARLAKVIEVDRLGGGAGLPHSVILDALRPVLRSSQRSERMLTPLRLFCRPFEDLLTSRPPAQKQRGTISRNAVAPMWNWLAQSLMPEEASTFVSSARALIITNQMDQANAKVQAFWPAASKAMLDALSTDKGKKAAANALGNGVDLADIREMALLLGAATDVIALQDRLPKPYPSLSEDDVWALREIHDHILETMPDAAPYVAVISMKRLERPWEALRLPLQISRQTQDTLISKTDMGLVGEILLTELEDHMASIAAMKPKDFDANAMVGHIARFAELSTGLVKSVDIRRDGDWGQRLLKDRSDVSEIMDGFMERAPKEVAAAIPMIKTGRYAASPKTPDLSRAVDPEKSARAIAYAQLISGCRHFAAAASFAASLKEARDQITMILRCYNEDIIKELRAAEGERREHAEHYFGLAADLTTHIMGTEDGELLRRRGRAAISAAAAA